MTIHIKNIVLAITLALSAMQPLMAMDTPNAIDTDALGQNLMTAVQYGHAKKVNDLIAAGAPVNYSRSNGTTPLMQAATGWSRKSIGNEPYVAIAHMLLEKGAQINQTNKHGNTALMCAAGSNNAPLCKLLIDNGAILEKKQTEGLEFSACHFAATYGHTDAITTLLTTIPMHKKLKIRKTIGRLYQIKHAKPQLPRDVRKLITQEIINELVNDEMDRIEQLLRLQDRDGAIVRNVALRNNHPETAQLLDLTNPESYTAIRKQIKNNISRILLGEPQVKAEPKKLTHSRILLGEPQVKAEPKKLTHFETIGIESNDSEKEAKEKIAMYFLRLKKNDGDK
jgi:hypothetical protein